MRRTLIAHIPDLVGHEVMVRGWVHHLRVLARTSFIVLNDCTGWVQCVGATERLRGQHLNLDDAIEISATVRAEPRSRAGFELEIRDVRVLNRCAAGLPFSSSSDISGVAQELILDHRPLSLRNPIAGEIFKVQAAIVELFREFLQRNHFTEIITSKIVAGGTEGGTNLFEIRYFDRAAYLAQSPQFYKEHGVAGFERVFETGHVYRAEPHATSRHLTEYYSLDLEMGFIDGPEDVIELERELLGHIFEGLGTRFPEALARRTGLPLPSMAHVPVWEFGECLDRLRISHGRTDLTDDLDPAAERQLCALAQQEHDVPAVFVLGYPLASRPFYTRPRGQAGAAQSFDLLFRGTEITTGGERISHRDELERAIAGRGMDQAQFEGHLRMFDLGMPPHGGLAIGLERLTMLALGLANVREATMYPRDRTRIEP